MYRLGWRLSLHQQSPPSFWQSTCIQLLLEGKVTNTIPNYPLIAILSLTFILLQNQTKNFEVRSQNFVTEKVFTIILNR